MIVERNGINILNSNGDENCNNISFSLISKITRKTSKSSEHPSKRYEHKAFIYNKTMILFGGRNIQRNLSNIFSLDLNTLSWKKIDQIGISPQTRESSSVVLYNNEMILFGGIANKTKLNDLWSFNFLDKRWNKNQSNGINKPCSRDNHLMSIIYNNFMILFGGKDENDQIINTTHLLDLRNYYWNLCKNEGDILINRFACSICNINDVCYYFGGIDEKNNAYNDLHCCNYLINESTNEFICKWSIVDINKNSPLPNKRYYHSSIGYKNKFIFIIAGKGENNVVYNDIWMLDIEQKFYYNICLENNNDNKVFDNRYLHSSIIYNNDIIIVYGGCENDQNVLDSLIIFGINDKKNMGDNLNNNKYNMSEADKSKDNKTNNFINSNGINNNSNNVANNNNNSKKSLNIRDIGTDTNDLGDQDFYTFEEIKKNYLNNLISWTFLKKLADFNQWPIGCIGNFINNSLKDHIQSNNIYIDFDSKDKIDYFSIIDDGKGMHCAEFNQIMYSFSKNENNEYNFFNYGISMKSSAMRLADSFLIITKTDNDASIGLISINLQKKIDSDLILTPIVNYNVRNKEKSDNSKNEFDLIPKSNYPVESLNLILEDIKFLFKNSEDIKMHILNMKTGTQIYLYNLIKNNDEMNGEYNYELIFSKENNDIYYRSFYEECHEKNNELIDLSLVKYLNFSRLEHNTKCIIYLFGQKLNLVNPYYNIKLLASSFNETAKLVNLNYNEEEKKNSFIIEGSQYNGCLFNEKFIDKISEDSICDVDDIKQKNYFNGVLLYRGNELICRINQSKFGDLSYFIKKMIYGKNSYFKINGYIKLPIKGYDVIFNGKEIKDLAVFGYLFVKVKSLMKKINKE